MAQLELFGNINSRLWYVHKKERTALLGDESDLAAWCYMPRNRLKYKPSDFRLIACSENDFGHHYLKVVFKRNEESRCHEVTFQPKTKYRKLGPLCGKIEGDL